jgi:hypothetical protein
MAEGVKLEVTGFKSLNEQLGQAEDKARSLVNQFGAGSKEVQKAAQEAGNLKQQMIDANKAIDSFTASGKFDAVAGGIQGVVGGFAAVQGAMAVVGVESEGLQQTLLKVQGSLALVEGVKGVMEFAKSFSTLKTVAVNAFNGIKAAIGSTGIGLLIIGLGIAIQQLIQYFDKLSEVEVKNKARLDDLTDSYKKFSKEVEKANSDLKRATEIAVAQAELEGKSIEKIAAIKKKASNEESFNIATLLDNLRKTSKERIDLAGKVAKAEGKDVEEARKTASEQIKQEAEALNEKLKELDNQRQLDDIALKKAQKDRDKKAADDRKKQLEDEKKNELEAAKALREALRKLEEEKTNDAEASARLKLKNDLIRLKEARDEELKQENLTDKAKKAISERYFIDSRTRLVQFNEEIDKITKDKQKAREEAEKAHQDKLIAERERNFARSTRVIDEYFKYQEMDIINSAKTQEEIGKEIEDLELKRLERQLAAAEEYGEDTIDIELAIAQKKREIRQREIEEEKERQQVLKDFVFNSLNTLTALTTQFQDNEIESRRANIVKANQEELSAASTTAERKAQIQYEMALAMEELNKEQFENQKAMNIVQATISGTQAAINAYAAGAIFGPQTAATFAAISGIFTAAQIGLIASQQYVPAIIREPSLGGAGGGGGAGSTYEQGGLLMGPSHNMGGIRTTLGEMEGGEFIMNKRSTANFLPLLEKMNAMGNENGPEMAKSTHAPVIKTYVVASEMTSQQEADARISRLARF